MYIIVIIIIITTANGLHVAYAGLSPDLACNPPAYDDETLHNPLSESQHLSGVLILPPTPLSAARHQSCTASELTPQCFQDTVWKASKVGAFLGKPEMWRGPSANSTA